MKATVQYIVVMSREARLLVTAGEREVIPEAVPVILVSQPGPLMEAARISWQMINDCLLPLARCILIHPG